MLSTFLVPGPTRYRMSPQQPCTASPANHSMKKSSISEKFFNKRFFLILGFVVFATPSFAHAGTPLYSGTVLDCNAAIVSTDPSHRGCATQFIGYSSLSTINVSPNNPTVSFGGSGWVITGP